MIREDYSTGFYYGFPVCCVNEFVRFMVGHAVLLRTERKLSGTGYIPCVKCNAKTEQELIDTINANRSHPRPFPDMGV